MRNILYPDYLCILYGFIVICCNYVMIMPTRKVRCVNLPRSIKFYGSDQRFREKKNGFKSK